MEIINRILSSSSFILFLVFIFPLRKRPLSKILATIFAIIFFWDFDWGIIFKDPSFAYYLSFVDQVLGSIFVSSLYYYIQALIDFEKKISFKFLAVFTIIPILGAIAALFFGERVLILMVPILIFYTIGFSYLIYKGIKAWKIDKNMKYPLVISFSSFFIASGWIDIFLELNLSFLYSLAMILFSLGVFYDSPPELKVKSKKNKMAGQINKIDTLLKEKLKEEFFLDPNITLSSVSEELGTTTHNLSNFLNNYYGKNFNEYVNTFRIEKAKKLLIEEKDKTILEICFRVGFNTSSTFYKAFQKKEEMAPGKYRKLNKK